MVFECFIPLIPKPQPRPRFTRYGHCYEPKEITDYKNAVRFFVRSAMNKKSISKIPDGVPILISAVFFFPVPTSWKKADREAALNGSRKHLSRPDVDNLVKALKDALTGVLWHDDDQVYSYGNISKTYSINPGISLYVLTEEDKK